MNTEVDAKDRPVPDDFSKAVPATVAVSVLQAVATKVATLHASGRIHRAITISAIERSSDGRIQLSTEQNTCWLGRSPVTTAWLPPELNHVLPCELPSNYQAAAAVLAERGIALDPRQIDIYQMGVLFCHLLSGESADSYLRRLKTRNLIPQPFRSIIEQSLGCDGHVRFSTIEDFSKAASFAFAQFSPESVEAIPVVANTIDRESETQSLQSHSAVSNEEESFVPVPHIEGAEAGRELPFLKLGHFEIHSRLGQGGMGDVYLGYEASLDRKVAIKVLPAEFARQPEFVRRFRIEATTAAKLIHPNIIQIYFIGESNGHNFFAMQYVEGISLADLLRTQGQLNIDQTLAILEQVFSGLHAAHDQGLVHRDIKPGNVLLDRNLQRALLADFGLVKSLRASAAGQTVTGVIMGTAEYMPPEQGRGKEIDHRADLYSMGVLMFQMLSGRLPFEADSTTAMIFQHVYEQPPSLNDVAPKIPSALAQVTDKLLRKSPGERFQSANEVLAALRAFREGKSYHFNQSEPKDDLSDLTVPTGIDVPVAQPTNLWQRVKNRALSLFDRHAPEMLDQLQGTQQQVDGAIRRYERRSLKHQQLINEAEALLATMKQQANELRVVAKNDSSQESFANEMDGRIADQEDQLGSLRLEQSRLNATLRKLSIQRDLLNARLNVARAGGRIANGESNSRRWSYITIIALIAVVIVIPIPLVFWVRTQPKSQTITTRSERKPLRDSRTQEAGIKTPRVATNSNPETTEPESPEVLKNSVNLLEKVVLTRDVAAGKVQPGPDGFALGPSCYLHLPVKPPSDYQLRFDITRIQDRDTFSIGFVMSGRLGVMSFDYGNGLGSGLYLDSSEPKLDLIPGMKLLNDQPARIVLTVHPGHLVVTVNGKLCLDWYGNPERLCAFSAHLLPFRETPFLSTANSRFLIKSARLLPIDPEKPTERLKRLSAPVDLISKFDLKRDVQRGNWVIQNGVLQNLDVGLSSISLPIDAPEEYTLSGIIDVPESSPQDALITLGITGLPVFGQTVIGPGDLVGLDAVDGRRWNVNETTASGFGLRAGASVQFSQTVSNQGIRLELDGRMLINWYGDQRRLSIAPDWALPDGRKLFLGAIRQFRFRELSIGPPTEPVSLPQHEPYSVGKAIDLLPLVNPSQNRLRGSWFKQDNAICALGDADINLLAIPADVPDEYRMRMIVSRQPGGKTEEDCLFVNLPIGTSTANITIDGVHSKIDGVYLDGEEVQRWYPENRPPVIPRSGRQELTFYVRRTGGKVMTPEGTLFEWKANPERLVSHPALATPQKRIAIGSYQTGFRFDLLEVEPLPPTDFPIPPSPLNGRDLLSIMNAERDARRGNWILSAEGLMNTEAAASRIRIPAAVPKSYVLTAEVTRLSGTNQLYLGLLVDGHPCSATVDLAGHYSGLDQLDGANVVDHMNLSRRHYQRTLLPLSKTVTVRCLVAPGTVIMTCDDLEIVRWHGDSRRLSLDQAYRPPNSNDADNKHFWIGTTDSQFLISDFLLQPLSDEKAEGIASQFSDIYPTNSIMSEPLRKTKLKWSRLIDPTDTKLKILSARYGRGTESIDITNPFSAAAASGKLIAVVDESLETLSDEKFSLLVKDLPKSLRLRYQQDGRVKLRTFGPNDVVNLGSDPLSKNKNDVGFRLLEARVGTGLYSSETWADLTPQLKSFAKETYLSLSSAEIGNFFTSAQPASASTVPRSTLVRYQQNGREHLAIAPAGSPVLIGDVPMKPGLLMTLYDRQDLQQERGSRIERVLSIDFGHGAPQAGMNPDSFSISWSGFLKVPAADRYTFYFHHDDGGRIWIDGNLVVDHWHEAANDTFEIFLDEKLHTLNVDFVERQVVAGATLEWKTNSIPREIVPPTAFFHDPKLAVQMGVK